MRESILIIYINFNFIYVFLIRLCFIPYILCINETLNILLLIILIAEIMKTLVIVE